MTWEVEEVEDDYDDNDYYLCSFEWPGCDGGNTHVCEHDEGHFDTHECVCGEELNGDDIERLRLREIIRTQQFWDPV